MFEANKWLNSLVDKKLDIDELEDAIERVSRDKTQILIVTKFAKAGELSSIARNMELWIRLLREWKNDKESITRLMDMCLLLSSHEDCIEAFLKDLTTVKLFVDLMQQYPLKLEYTIICLLQNLAQKKPTLLTQQLLQLPPIISEFVACLEHSKVPYLRNEVLLLLKAITRGNQDVQKIVAYSDGFPLLLTIIKEEGGSNGTEVVEDCLQIIRNLLENHALLVNLFGDSGGMRNLVELLEIENESDLWIMTEGKVEILLVTMQIMDVVLESVNPFERGKYQNAFAEMGGVEKLSVLALDNSQTLSIKSQSLHTLSLLLESNIPVSGQFSTQTQKLLLVIRETKYEKVRLNALSCLSSYLTNNPDAQEVMTRELFHKKEKEKEEEEEETNCLILSFLIMGNERVKSILGIERFERWTHQVMEWIQFSSVESSRIISLLRVIVVWLDNSPEAVNHFSSHLNFFLNCVENHTDLFIGGLCALIVALNGKENKFQMLELILSESRHDISVDHYVERLTLLSQQFPLDHKFNLPLLSIIESLYRSVIIKLIPHSNEASLKWEKIQESESRHLTERNDYLEKRVENLCLIIKELELRLLPDSSPLGVGGGGGGKRNDIVEMHQNQMKEKEKEIKTLMRRVNDLSDHEAILMTLEKSKKKVQTLKDDLKTKIDLVVDLSCKVEEMNNTMYSNMGILHNKIGELERTNDVLVLMLGKSSLKITSYEEQLGIPHQSDDEEEEEEEEEEEV